MKSSNSCSFSRIADAEYTRRKLLIGAMIDGTDLDDHRKLMIKANYWEAVRDARSSHSYNSSREWGTSVIALLGQVVLTVAIGLQATDFVINDPIARISLTAASMGLSIVIGFATAMSERFKYGDKAKLYQKFISDADNLSSSYFSLSGRYEDTNWLGGYANYMNQLLKLRKKLTEDLIAVERKDDEANVHVIEDLVRQLKPTESSKRLIPLTPGKLPQGHLPSKFAGVFTPPDSGDLRSMTYSSLRHGMPSYAHMASVPEEEDSGSEVADVHFATPDQMPPDQMPPDQRAPDQRAPAQTYAPSYTHRASQFTFTQRPKPSAKVPSIATTVPPHVPQPLVTPSPRIGRANDTNAPILPARPAAETIDIRETLIEDEDLPEDLPEPSALEDEDGFEEEAVEEAAESVEEAVEEAVEQKDESAPEIA